MLVVPWLPLLLKSPLTRRKTKARGRTESKKTRNFDQRKKKETKTESISLELNASQRYPGIPPRRVKQFYVGVSTGEPQDCFAVEIPETIGTGNRSYVLYIDIPTNSGCRTCRSDIRRRIHNETKGAFGVAVDTGLSCGESWHVRARECNHKPGDSSQNGRKSNVCDMKGGSDAW